MTQATLSNLFNRNYKEIYNYATAATKVFNKVHLKESILSDLYIYLDKNKEKLKEENEVISWSKTFIKNHCRWKSRSYNKEEVSRGHEDIQDYLDIPIEFSISSEFIENFILDFSKYLSPYEKRLFNIYTIKGLINGKSVKSHLGISLSSAYIVIREAKEIHERFEKWAIKESKMKFNF